MEKRFRNWAWLTIISVYLLILVGGVVRSTGSGMGCPDWPRCFGSWIPPVSVSQLPEHYQTIYTQKRLNKNEKLGKLLTKAGFTDLAYLITHDPSVFKEEPFNVTKTWIEYLNRLLGALIGLFIFLTAVFSFSYWKKDRIIFFTSLGAFVLVGIQGWIGSVVVSTNLLPGMITLHMVLALGVVFLLIFGLIKSEKKQEGGYIRQPTNSKIIWILGTAFLLTMIQVILGSQVRQAIDVVSDNLGQGRRGEWVTGTGLIFYIHRSFSWVVLVANGYLVYLLRNQKQRAKPVITLSNLLLLSLGIAFFSGAGMAWFGLPGFLQPVHLTLASLTAGIQFGLLVWLRPQRLVESIRTDKTILA